MARTQTSAVSELAHNTGHQPLWNEVEFTDCDPHYYTRRVKEAIHVRLRLDNINRESGIEIPDAWVPSDSGPLREQISENAPVILFSKTLQDEHGPEFFSNYFYTKLKFTYGL